MEAVTTLAETLRKAKGESLKSKLCQHFRHEKRAQIQLSSLDIFRWGRGLPHEGVGAKKFDMSLETREIKLFWRDIPGLCRDLPEVPEKFEKIKFVFNFWPLAFLTLPRTFP